MPLFAGFDLGGTQLKYGLVDEKGHVVFHKKVKTPEKIETLLQLLNDLWKDLEKKQEQPIKALGFGFPGIFSQKDQRILQSPNYPGIDNINLSPAISQFIPVPFTLNNDANMAAFGEYMCGAGQGVSSMILLTLGTGVGSGVILGGKLWQGACGFAGELGHVVVNPGGEKCKCGSQGCLETEVSAPKIVRNYKTLRQSDEKLTSEEIFHRAKRGDAAAQKAFYQAAYYLGISLSLVINLLNPEKILLGGGVIKAAEFLLPPAMEEAKRRSYKASYSSCRIEKSLLGNKAGFIGAALWAKENTFIS